MLLALIAVLCGLLILYWALSPRVAPPQVVEQVMWDYRQAQEWLATCAACVACPA